VNPYGKLHANCRNCGRNCCTSICFPLSPHFGHQNALVINIHNVLQARILKLELLKLIHTGRVLGYRVVVDTYVATKKKDLHTTCLERTGMPSSSLRMACSIQRSNGEDVNYDGQIAHLLRHNTFCRMQHFLGCAQHLMMCAQDFPVVCNIFLLFGLLYSANKIQAAQYSL
jgi:hypothetical protein